ncbi:MAG: GTP 3',8-cyclase MoaA, partial [Candidatus Thermoplasmatota archaeon]|nr:GTP 3',8-cyclase MoaA [Candidatus Thermoplasmatota archaeon]
MKDPHGREITNLRISLTQSCDLRCFYCHQEGEEENKTTSLKAEEVKRMVETASELGMHKVKYSGGEPLLHPELEEIIEHSSQLMDDISITTNGTLLEEKAEKLKSSGLDRVNVSLDSVNPETYKEITGNDSVEKVKRGIKKAVEVGLFPVKVNMLLLDGLNDDEVWDMIDWVSEVGAILQVIELTGNEEEVKEEFYKEYHHSLKELASELEEKAKSTERREMHARKKYFLKDPEVEVELVRSMHNSTFCENCTRLRITSE